MRRRRGASVASRLAVHLLVGGFPVVGMMNADPYGDLAGVAWPRFWAR